MAERNADRPNSLVESHKGYDPRIVFFYFVIAVLLLVLIGGLAYRQLFQNAIYRVAEKQQNERRVLIPGPRGNIYDREGRILVRNRPRFAVTLGLDELGGEFYREFLRVGRNYREMLGSPKGGKGPRNPDMPNDSELWEIARYSVAQRYLDQVNATLGRSEKVDAEKLKRHFEKALLLPYTLLSDLSAEEYAKLVEQLPVRSPVQVYALSARDYPYGSAAAHTLGYVVGTDEIDADDAPGAELKLKTFPMKSTVGKAGLESKFDSHLQGETGGAIYRVSPGGYPIQPALERRAPVQGKNLITSLDIDLQLVAEKTIGDMTGCAVAIDVHTGEILALASKPDYNLNDFAPRISNATVADINERGAWLNRAIQGLYPPGSTFKILVSIAGLRAGTIDPTNDTATCVGTMRIPGRTLNCDNGLGHHGTISLAGAIAQSCDIYYYQYGMKTTAEVIAAEARRFHLDKPTSIELPSEAKNMIIPDPEWRRRTRETSWNPGDTANMSIGQGDVLVSPIEMACFAASVARDETFTTPTLVHSTEPRIQHAPSIGLTPIQRATILDGMERCVTEGTAKTPLAMRIPGVRVAGKTGTAQIPGHLNVAWFICFAPLEKPEIAMAIAVEGDTPGENFAGGSYAAPVAMAVLRKYFDKKQHPNPTVDKLAINN